MFEGRLSLLKQDGIHATLDGVAYTFCTGYTALVSRQRVVTEYPASSPGSRQSG